MASNIKQQIFDKSVQLFLHKGYNATTVKDITDAVGVTKGAFYWHFKSKEELLLTIINHYESAFTDTIISEVKNTDGNFIKKFKYAHKWAVNFAYENRELCVCYLTIAAEMIGSKTNIGEKIRTIYKKYHNFLKELFEIGKKEGYLLDNLDINIVANVVNAIHNGSLLEWYIHYEKIDAPLFARTYRDIILYGVLKNVEKNENK